jgi:nitroreductase
MNAFLDLAKKRHSVRKYSDKPVERDKILKCLEAARLAPSASNREPWRYLIIDDPELKGRVCDAAFSGIFFMNKFAKEAPVIVAVIAEPDFVTNRLGALVQGLQFYMLDIGASIEHFMLQATELGLGCCWIGWYSEGRVKETLKIPKSKKIASLICLGYPVEEGAKEKQRKSLEEISSFNSYKQ